MSTSSFLNPYMASFHSKQPIRNYRAFLSYADNQNQNSVLKVPSNASFHPIHFLFQHHHWVHRPRRRPSMCHHAHSWQTRHQMQLQSFLRTRRSLPYHYHIPRKMIEQRLAARKKSLSSKEKYSQIVNTLTNLPFRNRSTI